MYMLMLYIKTDQLVTNTVNGHLFHNLSVNYYTLRTSQPIPINAPIYCYCEELSAAGSCFTLITNSFPQAVRVGLAVKLFLGYQFFLATEFFFICQWLMEQKVNLRADCVMRL